MRLDLRVLAGGSPPRDLYAGARVSAVALTAREKEVAIALARDLSVAESAHLLGISDKTVKAHRTRIFQKLNCGSAGVVVHAVSRGWVTAGVEIASMWKEGSIELKRDGDDLVVSVERSGKWVEVIRTYEPDKAPIGHAVHPSGINEKLQEAGV